jgi:hypothetical protein
MLYFYKVLRFKTEVDRVSQKSWYLRAGSWGDIKMHKLDCLVFIVYELQPILG